MEKELAAFRLGVDADAIKARISNSENKLTQYQAIDFDPVRLSDTVQRLRTFGDTVSKQNAELARKRTQLEAELKAAHAARSQQRHPDTDSGRITALEATGNLLPLRLHVESLVLRQSWLQLRGRSPG